MALAHHSSPRTATRSQERVEELLLWLARALQPAIQKASAKKRRWRPCHCPPDSSTTDGHTTRTTRRTISRLRLLSQRHQHSLVLHPRGASWCRRSPHERRLTRPSTDLALQTSKRRLQAILMSLRERQHHSAKGESHTLPRVRSGHGLTSSVSSQSAFTSGHATLVSGAKTSVEPRLSLNKAWRSSSIASRSHRRLFLTFTTAHRQRQRWQGAESTFTRSLSAFSHSSPSRAQESSCCRRGPTRAGRGGLQPCAAHVAAPCRPSQRVQPWHVLRRRDRLYRSSGGGSRKGARARTRPSQR